MRANRDAPHRIVQYEITTTTNTVHRTIFGVPSCKTAFWNHGTSQLQTARDRHAVMPPTEVGWLPKTLQKHMGRGAPNKAARTVKACKRCKKAKHKCDDSRPCRRCLFMGKQAECSADVGQAEAAGIAAGSPVATTGPQSPSGGAAAGAGGELAAGGNEGLVVASPYMEVVSLSPALARRYQLPSGDLVGTNLLAWFVEDGHEELLAAIASVIAGPTSKSMELVGKMYVQRRALTAVHQCTLRVSSCGSSRVALRIAWGDSMRLWEAAITATGNLPRPIASSIQRSMRANLQGAVFGFDELQSQGCMSEYVKASMARTGSSPTVQVVMDKLLSWGPMWSTVMQWKGLRALSSFAGRMLQARYEIEEAAPGATQPSTAILQLHARMKLPEMMSGAATPWLTVQRMVLNGEMCSSLVAGGESISATILLDASSVDPRASGPQDVPLALSALRCKAMGDAARGQRLELIERLSLTYTPDQAAASTVVLPVAAKAGAEQASDLGAPDTSMESLIMSMQPWTGRFIFPRERDSEDWAAEALA